VERLQALSSGTGVRRYLPALVVLGLGMALHATSFAVLGRALDAIFFVYLLALLIGAWCGIGPGLVVTALVIVLLPFLFRPGFSLAQVNVVGLACLSLVSLVVSRTAAARKRAEDRLRDLNADLENRVRRKTEELALLLDLEKAARAEADDANRLKEEFLATISHELRGPLQGIVGYAPLLLSGVLDGPTTRAAIEAIDRNAKALSKLIEDLLDVSMAVSGKFSLELATVNLAEVTQMAIANVQRSAQSKGILLTVDIDPAVEPLSADATRLQQAIWNLLSNAIKFTPRGGHVSVTIRHERAGALIEVADSGIGIPADFLPYVFDRFRQAEQSTTRTQGGLGLGLSIVRHVVLAHGGTVEAHSEGPGRGATFRVYLPSAPTSDAAAPPMTREPDRESRRLEGVKVLVLDDDPDSREILSCFLSGSGAMVSRAESAASAIQAIERLQPDVLVSDLALPGEDGFALMARLRSLGRMIPAIAVTGFASTADRARTRAAGFRTHLSKPIDREALVAAVAALAPARRSLPPGSEPVMTRS